MSTTTRSRTTKSTIELDASEFGVPGLESGERSAGGERSESDERAQRAGGRAQRGAGGTLRAAAGARQRELAPELIDDAVNRARVRSAIGPLPGGDRLSDEVIDELLAGASTEEEIAGPGGLLAQLSKRLIERPLEVVYPVIFLDAMVLKIREGGSVQRRACYLALGITLDGDRDVLGMWFQDTEGAKFWMQVLTDLKQRGVQDILICCVDGLKGFPEAIDAIFPNTTVQPFIVH